MLRTTPPRPLLARACAAALTISLVLAVRAPAALAQAVPAPLPPDLHTDAPVASAAPRSGAVRLDGRLDELAWAAAAPVTSFTQRDPQEGTGVSQPTDVRILYDADALYIGVRLSDTAQVTNRLGRRDMPLLNSDWFAITLDSYHDHRTAFRFQANPGGIQRDATISMGGGGEAEDLSWDAVWEVATTTDAEGWTAEFRIPFSQLRFQATAEEPDGARVWGIQLERVIGRRGEVAHFAFVPKREQLGVPRYGHLAGLRDLGRGQRLELLPYVAARGAYVDPGANPFRTDREHGITVGGDVRYRLTSNLTLNATVNPDFGQVEVDPAVVNLGVYEVFFPERRPFFVEGSEIFNFTGNTSGGNLFYSRRIGRQPQLRPPTSRADVPEVTTILGAAKLTGRTAAGWSMGVLQAVTGRENAPYLDAGDVSHTSVAEPLTNYFIGRVRRDLRGGRSAVGGALGSVVRNLSTPELERALRSSASSGGVDFRHEWAERSWLLTGSAALTHVRGSEAAIVATQRQSHHFFQRPDAAHLGVDTATSLTGYSTGLTLTKQAGEHWRGSIAGALTSPRYEANDLGFATRTDRRDLQGVLTYGENQPGQRLRDWSVDAVMRHESNFDGDPIQVRARLNATARFLNFWTVNAGLNRLLRSWDDRATRGGPLIERPREIITNVTVASDARRPISGSLGAGVTQGEYGGDSFEVNGSIAIRASPRWNLTVGPAFSQGRVAAQYLTTLTDPAAVATFGRRYLFAPLDFTQLSANVRLNVTFAPRLTLEIYAQPLVFASDYEAPVELAAPRTFAFTPFDGPLPSQDNTFRSLRGNAVLRWEWRPGSTLYVAWQQTRRGVGTEGTFDLGRDPRLLFGAAPDNILVVKATYWISP